MSKKMDPHRKVALITGSGRRRIGNVVARSLAEAGFSIALHYCSSEEAAYESRAEIRDTRVECEAFQANVAVEEEIDRMFDAVIERFGRLDVLVTTASVWQSKLLEDVTADDLRRSFDVNTLGRPLPVMPVLS